MGVVATKKSKSLPADDAEPSTSSRFFGGSAASSKSSTLLLNDAERRMMISYNDILVKRIRAEREIKSLRIAQNVFDRTFLKGGSVLKDLLSVTLCVCTSLDQPSDDCLVCNMPTSVKTSVTSPKNVTACGSVYLVSDYEAQMVQICCKDGTKVDLFWCNLANLVYLSAYLISEISIRPSGYDWNGEMISIPLGSSIRLSHNWIDNWTKISDIDTGVSVRIDEMCDYQSLHQYCQDFPFRLYEVIKLFKPFVPCIFVHPFVGCNACNDYVSKPDESEATQSC